MTDTPAAPRALEGRVILITGAGSGLGRATALACAKQGATVILLGRKVAKLEAVYDEIEIAGATPAAIFPMNLLSATWADLFELAETIEREFGRLDGLVHCAAHFTSFSPFSEIQPKDWMDSLQVNLTASYTLTRLCLPLLQAAPSAAVVFVTDAVAKEPKPLRAAYGVTQYAIEGMVRAWSQELGNYPNLRLHTYDPGPMRTELRARGYLAEQVQKLPPPEAAVPGLMALLSAAPASP